MIVIRFIVLLFNVAVVGFLIYHMLQVAKEPNRSRKWMILVGGTILLLAPFGMFLRFFAPTPQYFFIYPLAIGLFLYLTRML